MSGQEPVRKFETRKAVRERVPMLVALTGASGSGKTYSALRLATGMAQVTGGRVIVIDTEANRSLHYADDFDFDFVEMDAPFSPNDYLAAIKHATGGSRDDVVVIDSMSHEHEGPGGVLEMHEEETERLMKAWKTTRDKAQMSGWAKPKQQRKRLIQTILRMGVNAVFCFRAKEKMDLSAKKPTKLGWMAVGGEEFIYEMLIHILLYPRGGGVPVWAPKNNAEDDAVKVPDKLSAIFPSNTPLDESQGRALAEWAKGDDPSVRAELDKIFEEMGKAPTMDDLKEAAAPLKASKWPAGDLGMLRAAYAARRTELESQNAELPDPPEPPEETAGTGDPAAPDHQALDGGKEDDGTPASGPAGEGSGRPPSPAPDEEPESAEQRAAFGLDPE